MKHIWITLLSLILGIPMSAQTQVWDQHVRPTLSDGFDTTGWVLVGSGVLAVAAAQTQDTAMRNTWNNSQRMSPGTSRFGDILGTGIPGATMALVQLIWDREPGLAHAEALIDTFLLTSVLKYSNGRSRPGNAENKQSMPSGHSSTTFASATSLTYSYGWKAAVPAYSLALLTGLSRISDDAHWFSDVVAGAFIGFFWGRATALHHLHLPTPVVSHEGAGLVWSSSF